MHEIKINTASKKYSVFIESSPSSLEPIVHNGKVLIVTNPKVSGLHLAKILPKIVAKEVFVCAIPDGEQYKNLDSVNYILECAFLHKLDRKSLFIAFGGGVVGDITGFAAGIFMRGVEFMQIPTTLLAQVDSSVGGKTGINNKFGKNLVGIFNQPKAVYAIVDFLKTLNSREFGAGVAEIIKMAVCFDKAFFEWLEKHDLRADSENLAHAIKRSVEIKNEVVSADERESGIRAALNYGHTFGHAIENLTNYTQFLHGECVAMGICMANDLALKLGLMTDSENARVKALLEKYQLPTFYGIENVENFYEKFFLDKKSMDSKITFILPKNLGDVAIRDDIARDVVLNVLEKYCART